MKKKYVCLCIACTGKVPTHRRKPWNYCPFCKFIGCPARTHNDFCVLKEIGDTYGFLHYPWALPGVARHP